MVGKAPVTHEYGGAGLERHGGISSVRVKTVGRWVLDGVVIVLLLAVVFLAYTFFANRSGNLEARAANPFTPAGKPIQVEVLNGCGASGAASNLTGYLRRHGFDVVDTRNYKSFDVRETLVIDRTGSLSLARQVASAVGVSGRNIIQEINPDYFVDVSIVIGKDYTRLDSTK